MIFTSEKQLLDYTSGIIGKTFGELDRYNLLQKKKDKGVLGKVVETGFYGYDLNNDSKADFDSLGIELKVSGFITNQNGTKSAKERLSLSMINYHDIIHETFEFSKMLFKNKKLLIIWYEYLPKVPYDDFTIKHFQLYDMENDLTIIQNDFLTIQNKIKSGNAHLLSEGDTSYLGAATKASSSKITTSQPCSKIPAKPRAFSLKGGYLTGILRNGSNRVKPSIPPILSVVDYIKQQMKPYFGKTQLEIFNLITDKEIKGNVPKQIGKMISNILIGKDDELPLKHDLFTKTTYAIKNISINRNSSVLERLTFRNIALFDFEVPWEESVWKSYFEEVTFILICYEGNGEANGYRKLKEIKEITFTDKEIENFGKSYEMVRTAITKRDINLLPYPSSFEGQMLEIAPRGKGGDKTYESFFDRDVTKTCFMISKEVIDNKLR